MEIKILGKGCPKCQRLEQLTRDVATELGVSVTIEHVRDMARIMAYAVLVTPALVVNGEVKVSGRMPSKEEIGTWLRASSSPSGTEGSESR
jgi:small redox-active disulfide protein 2